MYQFWHEFLYDTHMFVSTVFVVFVLIPLTVLGIWVICKLK